MKRTYRWRAVIISSLLMMSSCNNDDLPSALENNEPFSVNFTLGGSAGTLSRAASEIHNNEEKAVKSLWAVAFNDLETTSDQGTEQIVDDKDTFFKAIRVDIPTELQEENQDKKSFTFSLGKEGNFQICFISNAGADLENFLGALTSAKTVKDLKTKLISQACDDKTGAGLLMTSPFYPVKSSWTVAYTIEKVDLTRAMARIDVYNGFAGMTIKSIKFVNRAEESRLYKGNATGLEEGITLKSKEYKNVNLVGNAGTPAGYTANIYTYEQLANTEQGDGDKLPAIEITYTLDGKPQPEKTHTVKLVYKGGDNRDVSIGLKRNHLYKVTFTRKESNINASLKVLDWNKGDEISVKPGEIGGGTEQKPETGNGILTNPENGGELDVFE